MFASEVDLVSVQLTAVGVMLSVVGRDHSPNLSEMWN